MGEKHSGKSVTKTFMLFVVLLFEARLYGAKLWLTLADGWTDGLSDGLTDTQMD